MQQFPSPSVPSGAGQGSTNIVEYSADDILLMKNIRPDIINNYDDTLIMRRGIYADMEQLGREEITTTTENYHYQQGSYYQVGTVVSLASASASSVTVTVNAQGTAGAYYSFGKVGDMVSIGGTKYLARIQSKSDSPSSATHTFVLSRGDNTEYALNDTAIITAGTELSAPFSAQAHGEAFPNGIDLTQTRFLTTLHYMVTSTSTIFGDVANQEMYIQIGENAGTRYVTDRQIVALAVRSQLNKAFAMLFADGTTFTGTDINGQTRNIPTTTGLYPTADQFATKFPVTPGYLDVDDIYSFANQAKLNMAGNEFMGYFGDPRKQEWDMIWQKYFPNGAVQYASFSERKNADGSTVKINPDEAKQMAVDLGYNSISVNGITFHCKTPLEFSHLNVAKNTPNASYYRNTILFVPAKNGVITFNGSTAQGLSFGIKSRMQRTASMGGPPVKLLTVNQTPANFNTDGNKRSVLEEFGLTTYNASKMIYVTP